MRKFVLDIIYSDPLIGMGIFFLVAFLLTFYVVPKVATIAKDKNLIDVPIPRSSHETEIPNLGGVAFFFTLIICLFFLYQWDKENIDIYIIPGLTVLFIVGLKDDLVSVSPRTKLFGELFAIFFIILHKSLAIHSLNGFLGIWEIPYYVGIPLSGLTILIIINAYNLIDGIDGLASIIGIVIFGIYGALFFHISDLFFTGLSVVSIGTLLAFLYYNLSNSKKIFMGDTGSLIIGFIIGIFSLRFLSLGPQEIRSLPILLENTPLIIFAILIVPFFDTGRVFFIRLMNKRNPFKADRNHIHHILIDFGFSHRKTSFILAIFNLVFFLFFLIASGKSTNAWAILSLFLVGCAWMILLFRMDCKYSSLKKRAILRKKICFLKKTFNSTPTTSTDKSP